MSKQKMKQLKSMSTNPEVKKFRRAFGNFIRENREAQKLSQEGLGQKADLDRQQIYRIENGLSGTKRDTIIRIAKALEIEPEDALNRAGLRTLNENNTVANNETLAKIDFNYPALSQPTKERADLLIELLDKLIEEDEAKNGKP